MKLALINGYGEKSLNDKTYYTISYGPIRVFFDLGKALSKQGHEIWFYHCCADSDEVDYDNLHFRSYSLLHRKFIEGHKPLKDFDCTISFEGWDKESRDENIFSILIANNIVANPSGYDKIACVSEFQRKKLNQNCGISLEKLGVISYGIDCSCIDRSEKSKPSKGSLFYSGNPLKGLGQIRAIYDRIKIFCDVSLSFISSNSLYGLPDRETDIGAIASLSGGRDVRLMSPLSYSDFINELKSHWLFFAPQAIRETYGLTFLEAAVSGLPVAVIDVGGNVPNLVRELESGIVAYDDDDFVAKFVELYNDDGLWEYYSQTGMTKARKIYTWERCVKQLESIIGV